MEIAGNWYQYNTEKATNRQIDNRKREKWTWCFVCVFDSERKKEKIREEKMIDRQKEREIEERARVESAKSQF